MGIGSTIAYLNINLDKVIVARFVNPAEYAIYINGAFEVPLIGMLTGAASAIILPDMIRSIKNRQGREALGLWKRAAVKSAALLFPITAVLWVMAPDIMVFLFGEAYVSSASIFRIYILLVPIRIGFFGVIYQACGKSITKKIATCGYFKFNSDSASDDDDGTNWCRSIDCSGELGNHGSI